MARQASRTYPKPLPGLASGPWARVSDIKDPAAARPDALRVLRNAYLEPGAAAVRVTGRPGFQQAGAQSPAGAATGQFVGQYTKSDGATFTIRIVGGRFETFDWASRTWSEVLTAADFAGAGITLHATNRIYAAFLADAVIFSDGVHAPWMWDGTAHGGLTSLTAAPPVRGQPWVYYAKLMGIRAANPAEFLWSEENQPAVGYDDAGPPTYNNAWQPLGASGFTHGAATNDAMYLFQARRVISITGAVADDFQTAGTRSAVSETVGTVAPPLVIDSNVYFVDAEARPHLIRPGGGVVPFWADCRETLRTVPHASVANAQLVHVAPANQLRIGLPGVGQTAPTMWLCFRLDAGDVPVYAGLLDGWSCDASGIVMDAGGVPTWMHLAGGFAYEHGAPDGSVWNDVGAAIAHELTPQPLGVDAREDKTWLGLTLVTASETSMALSVSGTTPRGRTAAQAFTVAGAGDRLGSTFVLGASRLAAVPPELRKQLGVKWFGRWAAPTITHQALDERFGFTALTATAVANGDDPEAP